MGWKSSDVVRFDIGPLLQGQMVVVKLKSNYNSLIISPRFLECETYLWEIMGWQSCDVVRFDLWSLLQVKQGYASFKSPYNMLIIVFTGGIRWILWFNVCYTAAARREIFGVNPLRGKLYQLGSPN